MPSRILPTCLARMPGPGVHLLHLPPPHSDVLRKQDTLSCFTGLMDAHGPILAARARELAVGILPKLHGTSCRRALPWMHLLVLVAATTCLQSGQSESCFLNLPSAFDLIWHCMLQRSLNSRCIELQTRSRLKKFILAAPAQKHP